MNKINSSQIGSGLPLTDQECLEESWTKVRYDAEMMLCLGMEDK